MAATLTDDWERLFDEILLHWESAHYALTIS